jgi:uncharacterized lipoprotein YajG
VKKLFFLIGVFLLAGCANFLQTIFVPSQIEEYCQRISGATNGRNQTKKTCIQQERNAKDQLSKMTIPPHIERYCRQLSEATGGSYQVMLICIQQNIPAL